MNDVFFLLAQPVTLIIPAAKSVHLRAAAVD